MVDTTNIPPHTLERDTETESLPRPSEALSHWLVAQQTLAASANLALVTIGADNDLRKNVANETSICQSFLSDPVKARMCADFCGKARMRALAAGRPITYRCDANLHCFAAPLQSDGEPATAVLIGGRAFLSASDYRKFLQQETSTGNRPDPKLFSNIKFTDAEEFDRNQQKILTAAGEILSQDFGTSAEELEAQQSAISPSTAGQIGAAPALSPEQLETFFNGSFEHGCRGAMQLIGTRFQLASGALLMRNGRRMAAYAAGGEEREHLIGFNLSSDSSLLNRLQTRRRADTAFALTPEELSEIQASVDCTRADAFPFYIGEELTGMLLVLDTELAEAAQTELGRLGQSLVLPPKAQAGGRW